VAQVGLARIAAHRVSIERARRGVTGRGNRHSYDGAVAGPQWEALAYDGLDARAREALIAVREFVERDIVPAARALDAADEYPEAIVAGLRELGVFGFTIPRELGGGAHGLHAYCLAVEEIARGWMSVAGILNTHFIVCSMLLGFGTEEQRTRLLPRLATGELRAAFSMTEPHCGSDVQAIRTHAVREGDEWVVTGTKRWQANGLRAGLMALLVKTDRDADPPHRGMTCLLLEKTPGAMQEGGMEILGLLPKLGYLGIDSTAMRLEGHRVPASAVLGGEEGIGRGFQQMMSGVEVGRVNVAARAIGTAQRAYELAMSYAHEREAFGRHLTELQAIQFKLADMATRIEAARLLAVQAARAKDAGRRADVETGMAKLFASEMCNEVVLDAMRIHGGNGYSKEYEIERLYRDAPMLLLGEGTSEIQRSIIARGLTRRWEDERDGT
jgi:alkylation response protein AidB-like acyl-CoA dehydrogenase